MLKYLVNVTALIGVGEGIAPEKVDSVKTLPTNVSKTPEFDADMIAPI